MYSYDDRLRAVRLYIKLGKRNGLTIHQLGYPTKNALKTWYRECDQLRGPVCGAVRLLHQPRRRTAPGIVEAGWFKSGHHHGGLTGEMPVVVCLSFCGAGCSR
jgi:hypothetical protein